MALTIEQFVEKGFGWTTPSPNSKKNYRNHITQFETFLKERNKTAQDGTVSDQDILDYVEYLKSKYQPNTVAVKVAVVKSYFKWLKKEGALTYKPHIRSIAGTKITHKELDASDLNAMIKNMEGNALNRRRDRAMFALIVYCGFKTEEITAMNTEDIDFENAQITVQKSRKHVTEKCSVRAALSEMQAYKQTKLDEGFCWKNLSIEFNGLTWKPEKVTKEPFFLNRHHLRISGRSLRRRLMAYLEKANSYGMRDLRHTYFKKLDRIVQDQV